MLVPRCFRGHQFFVVRYVPLIIQQSWTVAKRIKEEKAMGRLLTPSLRACRCGCAGLRFQPEALPKQPRRAHREPTAGSVRDLPRIGSGDS